jgi:hypothetical protein
MDLRFQSHGKEKKPLELSGFCLVEPSGEISNRIWNELRLLVGLKDHSKVVLITV